MQMEVYLVDFGESKKCFYQEDIILQPFFNAFTLRSRCLLVAKRIYFMLVLVENDWSISELFYQMLVGMENTFYVWLAFCQTLRDDALHSVTRSLCPRVFVIFC